jgi:hypothetical protein
MPRITIRFALIALLLAAVIPTATGIGVSAYLNSWATVELLWHDLADEMIEAPGDVSASELLDRVESLAKTDVPEDWDGVMVLTDK